MYCSRVLTCSAGCKCFFEGVWLVVLVHLHVCGSVHMQASVKFKCEAALASWRLHKLPMLPLRFLKGPRPVSKQGVSHPLSAAPLPSPPLLPASHPHSSILCPSLTSLLAHSRTLTPKHSPPYLSQLNPPSHLINAAHTV